VGTDDKIHNKFDEKRGEVKEWVGEHTDDEDLERQGRKEQTQAQVRQAGEHVKDAVHDAGDHVKDAADSVRDAARRD
jgi:uncharacterized protein YjbJ (UPF0337 family)